METNFIKLCKNGNLEDITNYLIQNNNMDVNTIEQCWKISCKRGYLDVAQYIYNCNFEIDHKTIFIDISEKLFDCACING